MLRKGGAGGGGGGGTRHQTPAVATPDTRADAPDRQISGFGFAHLGFI